METNYQIIRHCYSSIGEKVETSYQIEKSNQVANNHKLDPLFRIELDCGCTIRNDSGTIHQECLGHKQGNFLN